MMKKITLLYFVLISLDFAANAQNAGDFRSVASGPWNAISIWERFDGMTWLAAPAVPNAADGIITIRSPHIVTVNTASSGDQIIIESGGALNIEAAFTLNDGTGDDMVVNGMLNFKSGSIDGAGTVSITPTATFMLSTGSVKTTAAGVVIINNGVMIWQEGGINGSSAVVNNNVFNISATALWQFSGGLTNSGTINKTAGSTNIATPWSNSGTINISGGTLTSSDIFTNTGNIIFSSGAAWQNNSTFNHNAGSVITGTGSFSNSGVLSLAIDQIFPASLVFSNSNTINGPGALTINNDFVIQGTINGGDMTLNGNGDWQGGTLGRSLTINAGRTLLLSTTTVKSSSGGTTLTNNGIMTWQEGGINGGGAVINNNVLNISATALWQFSGGLSNSGTINKTGGSTNIATPWSNSGTINLTGGTLTSSNVFTNTGTITFSSGAAWQNASNFNHNSGSIITGTGSFNNSGIFSMAIDQIFPATLVFSNSNTINGPGALTINNDFVIQGTINGGDMTLNGNGDWQGGTLGRSLTINAGRTLLLSTAAVKSSSGGTTLTNNGIMTWQEGGINASGAVINNNVLNISATALWQFSGGLTNSGTINKTGGSTNIATPWSNNGTIHFSGGTLTSSNVFTNTGTITFSSGAAWQNTSNFNHNSGSIITGTGSFNNSGIFSLAIDQIFPATLVFSNSNTITGPGALTINNDFVIQGTINGGDMTLNGNGDWQGGTLGRSLTINAGRTLLLSTAAVKNSSGGTTLTNNGIMTWQEGGINASGAVINNNVLNISATALWQFSGGLINNGILSNTGTPDLNTPVTNSISGTIQGLATILFSNTFTNNGIVAPGFSPGVLTVNGTQPFSASSTLNIEINNASGPGTGHDQLQRNSNLTLAGTLTVTETGTVPDGIYTIINLTSGTITGNFSTINLPTGYTIQVNPTNVRVGKNTPLALNLITFTAKKTSDKKVILEWITTDEQNVSHFEVERSTDLVTFTRLADVEALNSTEGGWYNYIDKTPLIKNNFYRLRMVDIDASAKLSPVITVYFNSTNEIVVFPTITTDKIQIQSLEEIDVQVYSLSGTLLQQKYLTGHDFIDLSDLPAGLYILKYGEEGNTLKIMKE